MSQATSSTFWARVAWAGALRFGLASVAVFATVAFAERWMYEQLGLLGAYLAWTLLFVALGGSALRPFAPELSARGFYLVFGGAFLAYSVGWVSAYFMLRGAAGEWLGGLAAALLMALVLCVAGSAPALSQRVALLLFVGHSAGYFSGSMLNELVTGRLGMLLWGVAYGLGLGAGLAVALHWVFGRPRRPAE